MLEQTVRFFQQEQYIDPKYRKQIEAWDKKQYLEKGKRIAGAMTEVERGNLLKGLWQSLGIGHDIRAAIKENDTSWFPYLLGLAILVDISDPIPVIGLIIKFVCKPILIYGTLFRGKLKYKIAAKFVYWYWGITAIEIVPGINFLPLETIGVLMLWRVTAKARREKENEEVDNDQTVKGWGRKIQEYDRDAIQTQNRVQTEINAVEQNAIAASSGNPRGSNRRPEYDQQAAA